MSAKKKTAAVVKTIEKEIKTPPSETQQDVIDTITRHFANTNNSQMSNFLLVKSAPGSGKTTTIVNSLKAIIDGVDRTEDEKILILAFNAKMKNEIEEKVKKAGFDMTKLEIRTIHSLFFHHTWRFLTADGERQREGSFKLDFTKGFFTKKMIKQVLQSLVSGNTGYDAYSESILSRERIFSENIMSDMNIAILHKYINAFYSSPYQIQEFRLLDHIADFFTKNDKNKDYQEARIADLELSNIDKMIIDEKFSSLVEKGYTREELFFLASVQRVSLLAKIKIMDEEEIVRTKTYSAPVEIINKDGSRKEFLHTFESHERNIKFHHIFEVPHNYYYKEFMTKAFSDHDFLVNVFSQYRAIFIDEAQDNDMIFFEILIQVLSEQICNLAVAVGDPHQAIYGFKSPDHFDILKYGMQHEASLKKKNIIVKQLPLGETFRFGNDIARFVNLTFPDAGITGKLGNDGFVANQPLTEQGLYRFVENVSSKKELKVGIICRTNSEALNLFLSLSKNGSTSVSIHTNIKGDIKDFVSKGLSGVDDERTRMEISEILAREGRKTTGYDDIMASEEAKKTLVRSGYGQLVKYTKKEIETYILNVDKKRKNVVITTAHQAKGAEYDFCVVAGDYFKKELDKYSASETEEDYREDRNFFLSKSEQEPAFSIGGMLNDIAFGESKEITPSASEQHTQPEVHTPGIVSRNDYGVQSDDRILDTFIKNELYAEERNTLYVAITRAKKGVFFMEGALFYSLLPKIESSRAWVETYRIAGDLLEDNTPMDIGQNLLEDFAIAPGFDEDHEDDYETREAPGQSLF